MKTIKFKTIAIFKCFLLVLTVSFGQTFSSNETDNAQQIGLLNNQLNLNVEAFNPDAGNSNSVFISQIGNENTSEVNVSSNNAISSINQIGNNNNSYISLNSSSLSALVLQLGNDHNYIHQNSFREAIITNNIEQQGVGQNLEINGFNSLMENAKILMRGNSQSVIIRNFK
jgi:hypothetical protein